jgi:hypothetical protein
MSLVSNSYFWSITITQIVYNGTVLSGLSSPKNEGIIDTGTSLTYIDYKVYDSLMEQYLKQYPVKCGKTYLMSGTLYDACYCNAVTDFDVLSFHMGGYELDMSPDEYIGFNAGSSAGSFCFFLLGRTTGSGFGANVVSLMGDSFM